MCDKTALVDLSDIRINTDEPSAERVLDFAGQMKNPYLFKVGEIAVNVIYCGDQSLSDVLANVLQAS